MRARDERDETTLGIGVALAVAGGVWLVGTLALVAVDLLSGSRALTGTPWTLVLVVGALAGASRASSRRSRAVQRAPGRTPGRTRRGRG